MGATILILVACGVLLRQAMAHPSVESVTYQREKVDHIEEFSIQTKIYFSAKHEAYRYDINGGMSKFFIYHKLGKVYYYYPTSDFPNKKFNITACYSLDVTQKVLPSPLPSTDGLPDLGPDHVYDMPAEKYGNESESTLYALWVTTKDAKTGTRPIKEVKKSWDITREGFRKGLTGHVTTEYYGFIAGEPDSSVWDRPSVACSDGSFQIGILIDLAVDIGVTESLVGKPFSSGLGAITKRYKKGRISPGANYQNDPLLLDFPWSPKQVVSMAETLPKSFDWRDFGAVTQVKNQRNCGSCWAYGAVGSLEGAYYLKYNELVTLSEQAMTDCAGSTIFGADVDGCFGGIEQSGFTWINRTGGIPPAEEYGQYQESNGYCRITDQTKLVAQLEGYYHVPSNTDALKVALVKLGPIAVGISADSIFHYTNGVINGTKCSGLVIDHSVLLVGYGESAEHGPYWIVKNSWDTTWGLEGYFLVSAKGNCLYILDEAYFPVLK